MIKLVNISEAFTETLPRNFSYFISSTMVIDIYTPHLYMTTISTTTEPVQDDK